MTCETKYHSLQIEDALKLTMVAEKWTAACARAAAFVIQSKNSMSSIDAWEAADQKASVAYANALLQWNLVRRHPCKCNQRKDIP
jgi:hypothetical protein